MNTFAFDFIVLGSGIAGLTFALEAAAHGKVLVICKAALQETNTAYAQGGIAATFSQVDSWEQHVQDTLIAGAGLCNETAVQFMVARAKESILWLEQQGTVFDRAPDHNIALGLEGGHCQHRIVHVKDHTGLSVQQALSERALEHPSILVWEHHMATDLLTQSVNGDAVCYGVHVADLQTGEQKTVLAKSVVLATGGSGQVYSHTTNPAIATGDGLAMASRAGASIAHMEFFQFHPTALFDPKSKDIFLVSEALRGAGAKLVLPDGTPFMQHYHASQSLAPRDVVARAVYEQMQLHQLPCLYLDARHLGEALLIQKFPSIYFKCLSLGIDPASDLIPIVPAAHYQCGGIVTDLHGQTSINGLYAVGEVACTGVHGANRLASNSLLEGLVFGREAAEHAAACVRDQVYGNGLPGKTMLFTENDKEALQIKEKVQAIMWEHAGIVRTAAGLQLAAQELAVLKELISVVEATSAAWHETKNLITVSELIVQACLKRAESIGGHFRLN